MKLFVITIFVFATSSLFGQSDKKWIKLFPEYLNIADNVITPAQLLQIEKVVGIYDSMQIGSMEIVVSGICISSMGVHVDNCSSNFICKSVKKTFELVEKGIRNTTITVFVQIGVRDIYNRFGQNVKGSCILLKVRCPE